MEFEQLTIDSKFLCVAPNDWAVVPKFAIIINGNSFEYSQSAQWLTKYYYKVSSGMIMPDKGSKYLMQDILKEKSAMLMDKGDMTCGIKRGNYRTIIDDNPAFTYVINKLSTVPMKLTDEEHLFALRYVLQDALFSIEMSEEDFINDFGYGGDYATMKRGISIYNSCRDTYFKLQLGSQQMYDLLDKLYEQGIE